VKAAGKAYPLHEAARIAELGADQLDGAQEHALDAVAQARADEFQVAEDLPVIDTRTGGSREERAARQALAQKHAAYIRHCAAGLVAVDREISANLLAATEGLGTVSFDDAPIPGIDGTPPHKTEHNGVQLVDNHFPLPERPRTDPEPPPGGWSHDPLTRAAQKIARGHSWDKHSGEFRGMTQDQLTNAIKDMLRRNSQDPASLIIGRTPDGAPVLYDPKKDIIVIRDPKALDAGTVFKPDVPDLEKYLGKKMPTRVTSIPPGELADLPAPAATPPGRAPTASPPGPPPASPKPAEAPPIRGRGLPELPFGPGLTAHSPATGPHPVYGPEHHSLQPPLLGEEPDEVP
jgi:hypothetical protein